MRRALLNLSVVACLAVSCLAAPAASAADNGQGRSLPGALELAESSLLGGDPEKARSQAQRLLEKSDLSPELRLKTRRVLAAALVSEATALTLQEEERAAAPGRRFVEAIVLLLTGAALLSLILRYGPERPPVITRASRALERARTRNQDDPSSQFVGGLLSIIFMALAAVVLCGLALAILWVVARFGRTERPEPPEIAALYDEAADLLAPAARGGDAAARPSRSELIGFYADYLEGKGLKKRAQGVRALLSGVGGDTCRLKVTRGSSPQEREEK